jgi:hypothetical protein
MPRISGSPFDQEAVRLVLDMPAWEPGKQDGENIITEQWLIIGFK